MVEVDVRHVDRKRPHGRLPALLGRQDHQLHHRRGVHHLGGGVGVPRPVRPRRLPDRRHTTTSTWASRSGWGDTYDWYRQLQWIDLGQNTLGSGTYVLRSVADPLNIVYESREQGRHVDRESVTDNEAHEDRSSCRAARSSTPMRPTGRFRSTTSTRRTNNAAVSIDIVGRDDVSGPSQFRLSNDGNTFKTFSYTSSGSTPTTVAWNLTDANYGGNTSNGLQDRVRAGEGQQREVGTDLHRHHPVQVGRSTASAPAATALGSVRRRRHGRQPVGLLAPRRGVGTERGRQLRLESRTYRNGVTLGRTSLLTSDPDKAAGFNGTNQYVSIPSSGPLSPASTVTWRRGSNRRQFRSGFGSVLTKPESYSLQFNGGRMEFTIMQGGTRRRLQAPRRDRGGRHVSRRRYLRREHATPLYQRLSGRVGASSAPASR